MKTIEQAAREYANSNFQNCSYHYLGDKRLTDFDAINAAFKKGKAFAEEWISFKDELPPFSSKSKILLKREKAAGETIYELRKFTTSSKVHLQEFFTHWRPINRE